MNLLSQKKKWFLGSLVLLVLFASFMGFWLNTHSISGDALPSATQKTQDMTSPQAHITDDAPTIAIVSDTNNSQAVTTAASDPVLPPISKEVANEIRRLSIQNSDGLVEEKQADGSVNMDLQGHFQSVTAAAIDANGKMVVRHGEDFLKNVK